MQDKMNETHKSCHKILMPVWNSIYQANAKTILKYIIKQIGIVSTKLNAGKEERNERDS